MAPGLSPVFQRISASSSKSSSLRMTGTVVVFVAYRFIDSVVAMPRPCGAFRGTPSTVHLDARRSPTATSVAKLGWTR